MTLVRLETVSRPSRRTSRASVGIDLRELGVSCQNAWNFAHGLKFKANFHSKMSVCRHELGGVQPQTPRQFQTCPGTREILMDKIFINMTTGRSTGSLWNKYTEIWRAISSVREVSGNLFVYIPVITVTIKWTYNDLIITANDFLCAVLSYTYCILVN